MKKLIKYDSYSAITIANDVLTKGGIIAYPTDTLYGLGCNAKNDSAIKNLNKITIQPLDEKKFINGVTISKFNNKDDIYRVFSKNNIFIGIGEINKKNLRHKQLV